MLKKLISLALLFALVTPTVFSDDLLTTADKVMNKLSIDASDNQDALLKYKNRFYIKDEDKPILARVTNAGLISSPNGIIITDSADLSPLVNGIISYGLKNKKYKIVTANYSLFEVGGAVVSKDTFFIDGEPQPDVLYSCLVDKNNNAIVMWKTREIKYPTVLRGKLYVAYDNKLVLTSLERSAYEFWIDEMKGNYIEVDIDNVPVKDNKRSLSLEEINANYLDKTLYILADYYDNKIKALDVEMGD